MHNWYHYYGTLYYAWNGTTQITESKNQTVFDFMGFLKASSGFTPYGLGCDIVSGWRPIQKLLTSS